MKILKIRPKDYHCNCVYCKTKFRGELLNDDGSYISARKRVGYSDYEKTKKHLCPGHWQGYSFIVSRYTEEGDIVFDPCAGTGTALVEAMKQRRRACGIELEFFDVLEHNCDMYNARSYKIFEGDAREIIDTIEDNRFDLIVTGTPYNNGSDAPERKNLKTRIDKTFDYKNRDNFAFMPDNEYYNSIIDLYEDCIEKLRKGGHFAIIIKDTIRQGKNYLLHHELASRMEKELKLKVVDVFIHKHYPPTLFISTYAKRHPGKKFPRYQTIVVMRK